MVFVSPIQARVHTAGLQKRKANSEMGVTPMSEQFDIPCIARLLTVDRQALITLGARAPRLYRRWLIRAGEKERLLEIPAANLRAVQTQLLRNVLQRVPIPACVFGVRGKGVIMNAEQHIAQRRMAVLDIADCFPNTRVDVIRGALEGCGFSTEAAHLVTQLTTTNGRLPQGAPTSPAVLNIVLRYVDAELAERARRAGAIYTRYMDDLCFSGPTELSSLVAYAKGALRRRGFRHNPAKCRAWGPGDPHTVTKIIVTTELNAQPEYIAALTDAIRDCRHDAAMLERLRSQIAWVKALNPRSGHALERRLASAMSRAAELRASS